jgi:hypothetical protein
MAVSDIAPFSTRRNSSEPTPIKRGSYPPARPSVATQSNGRTAVNAR